MARMVNTVRGPVSSDELGAVFAHEHFLFGFPGYQGDLSCAPFDKDAFIERCQGIFSGLRSEYGVKTVVDATPNDCGRDVLVLREIAEACDLNIIASTGYYHDHEGATGYWKFRKNNTDADVVDEIYQLFKTEMQEGVMGSGIKCATIKLASTGNEVSEYNSWFFKAAARLAKQDPNVRIITHSSGEGAVSQADFLLAEGVNPAHVQIGHVCGDRNIDNLNAIIDKGFYIAMDRIGLEGWGGTPTDDERFANIAKLAQSGRGDKVLLSSDLNAQKLGRPVVFSPHLQGFLKNRSFTYIFETGLKKLRAIGLTDLDIERLTIKNPAAFYGDN